MKAFLGNRIFISVFGFLSPIPWRVHTLCHHRHILSCKKTSSIQCRWMRPLMSCKCHLLAKHRQYWNYYTPRIRALNAFTIFILLCRNIHSPWAVWCSWQCNGEYIFLKAIYNSTLNSLITVEILYNLRLGSELDCKYGPDLEIKHFFFFQVKEEKST